MSITLAPILAPGAPLYLTEHLLSSAISIVAAPPVAAFPASAIGDLRVGTVMRLAATTGTVIARWASSIYPTLVGVLNHNLAPDAILSLDSSINGFSWVQRAVIPLDLSVTGGRNSSWARVTPPPFSLSFLVPYWRLSISSAGSGTEDVRIGEWWLGRHEELPTGWRWSGDGQGEQEVVRGQESELGVPSLYLVGGVARRTWQGSTGDALTQPQRDAIVRLRRAARGRAKPLLLVPYSHRAGDCAQVRLTSDSFTSRALAPGAYGAMDLGFIEDPYAEESP